MGKWAIKNNSGEKYYRRNCCVFLKKVKQLVNISSLDCNHTLKLTFLLGFENYSFKNINYILEKNPLVDDVSHGEYSKQDNKNKGSLNLSY